MLLRFVSLGSIMSLRMNPKHGVGCCPVPPAFRAEFSVSVAGFSSLRVVLLKKKANFHPVTPLPGHSTNAKVGVRLGKASRYKRYSLAPKLTALQSQPP